MWKRNSVNLYLPGQRPSRSGERAQALPAASHQRRTVLLAAGLLLLAVLACQSTPAPTETWIPPYLQAFLCGGAARVRWAEAADWSELQAGTPVVLRKPAEVMALTEGARLCLGDGSTLELSPGARVALQEPGSFPLLDVTVLDGEVTLVAQKASYRVGTAAISMTLLEVPSRVRVRLNGGAVYARIEEGAVNCATDDESITLPSCWEMRKPEGEAVQVGVFCATRIPTPSPTATRLGPTPTQTVQPSPSPSPGQPSPTPPSPSPTPTRPRRVMTATPSPTPGTPTLTPTMTPPPPPPPPPPPTSPPPSPTSPPPPPTDTPVQPTDTPERPTPTPERGTPGP